MKYDSMTPYGEGSSKDWVAVAGCDRENALYIKAQGVGYHQAYQPLLANRTNERWQQWKAKLNWRGIVRQKQSGKQCSRDQWTCWQVPLQQLHPHLNLKYRVDRYLHHSSSFLHLKFRLDRCLHPSRWSSTRINSSPLSTTLW